MPRLYGSAFQQMRLHGYPIAHIVAHERRGQAASDAAFFGALDNTLTRHDPRFLERTA